MTAQTPDATKGVAFGVGAYTMWGCYPLYFALLDGVPAWEILIHRVIWSCVFLAIVITCLGRWAPIRAAGAQPKKLGRVAACAVLIGINWFVYVYAVETHHVLHASLGYFLTPLVNVALGMLVLKEKMARLQAIAVVLAVVGILIQLVLMGSLPWISLVLACSFGTYGLMRKQVPLDGLSGLFMETLLLLPLGLLALAALNIFGVSHFSESIELSLLLLSSGIATAMPLLAFAGAARRLRLATVGFLMYINPTMQFFLAILVFNEALSPAELASFIVIWTACGFYSCSAWQAGRASRVARA